MEAIIKIMLSGHKLMRLNIKFILLAGFDEKHGGDSTAMQAKFL